MGPKGVEPCSPHSRGVSGKNEQCLMDTAGFETTLQGTWLWVSKELGPWRVRMTTILENRGGQ